MVACSGRLWLGSAKGSVLSGEPKEIVNPIGRQAQDALKNRSCPLQRDSAAFDAANSVESCLH